MHIELSIYGDTLVSRKLDRVATDAVRARPAFRAIADDMRGYEQRLFDTQGSSGGAPWALDMPSTLASKAARGLDPRVLHATKALRRSLTNKSDPMHEEVATDAFLVFGSSVDYGHFHQRGTHKMPRRRSLQLTEPQRRAIVKRLQTYVMTGDV